MKHFDIVVIGGGPAGMTAAIKAAEEGCTVALLEKNPFCGKKLNITGKGRCNITNSRPWAEFSTHIHPNAQFLRSAFYSFSNADVVDFFNSIGVPTVETQGCRIFPESMRASDVSRALATHMSEMGVEVCCDSEVIGVEKKDGRFVTAVSVASGASSASVSSEALIVTTGGLSYQSTGSTGFGYEIAKGFGHTLSDMFPSLTALKPDKYDTSLVGMELENVGLLLYIDKDVVQMEQGDLSFTDNGIEGSLGFRVSRKAVHALRHGQKVELELDLKPALNLQKLEARITRELTEMGSSRTSMGPVKLKAFIRGFMPASLVAPFVAAHPGLTIDNLAQSLKCWRFKIASFTGYERSVVTAGGISQKEIISKAMRSKMDPDLYFAGEVLDIDGDTGGYNLQIAFSTGALAGRSAAQRILNSRAGSE